MPSAMVMHYAFDQLGRHADKQLAQSGTDKLTARANLDRARQAKRALEPMVGEQVVEEATGPATRTLRLPSGKVVEIERFE